MGRTPAWKRRRMTGMTRSRASTQMRYDFAKVGRNLWLIQDMRELSQHGRAVTIAVDVRLYQLMKGEVRVTRSGRLSIQGRVPVQFWRTVYFEDTKTVIYTRGFELNVPRGLHKNEKTTEETITTFARERVDTVLASVESDAGSRDWRLIPRMRCYLCGKEIFEGVCWCPHCHRPTENGFPGGRVFSEERAKDLQSGLD